MNIFTYDWLFNTEGLTINYMILLFWCLKNNTKFANLECYSNLITMIKSSL